MSFATDVQRIAEKMNTTAEVIARNSIIELFSSVIRDTPVDTGRLRANWQSSRDIPASGRLASTDQGAALKQVAATVHKDPGIYYLTNNLPYAAHAEFGLWNKGPKTTSAGFSKKAPAGMVRKNVQRLLSILARAAEQ